MENPFRRNPIGGTIGKLQARASALAGNHTGFYQVGTRHPAWVTITGKSNSCSDNGFTSTLPFDADSLDQEYNSFSRLKPKPILDEVTIEYGGDFGLTMMVSAKILCFTKSDFERIEKAFLLPGNDITVSFGYGPRWSEVFPATGGRLDKLRVATYSFSATANGSWECSFRAVSAIEGLQDVDMGTTIKNNGNAIKYQADGKLHNAAGIMEMIAADAQKNGQRALDDIKIDEVITTFKDPPKKMKGVAQAVFNPDHLHTSANLISAYISKTALTAGSGDTSPNTYNIVYVSIGYIIERIFNSQIHSKILEKICDTDKGIYAQMQIVIDPELSVSYVHPQLRSGLPTSVLILGQGLGNYKNSEGKGKNFEENISVSPVEAASGTIIKGRRKIDLSKILLERSLIQQALSEASKRDRGSADSTDARNSTDEVVNFDLFFKKIFSYVSSATGGAIDMRLTEDFRNETRGMQYILIDQNNGYTTEPLQCVILNPIDGDGSTRSCTVQTGAGSVEYKAAMFANSSRKSTASTHIRGCEGNMKSKRSDSISKAIQKINEIVKSPGPLGSSGFAHEHQDSLRSQMELLAHNAPNWEDMDIHPYPGVSISAELDGIWGFLPGNAILSSQLPNRYRNNKLYFMVRTVTNTFKNSDWSTFLQGDLVVGNVDYIPLSGYDGSN